MEHILTAVISGVSVAIPSILATVSANKRNNDLILYRINELDEKVHKHNNLIERMYDAEKRIAILEGNKKD